MLNLLTLKKWLTIADSARYLSSIFGENVTEADLLQLVLESQITMSVYFPNGVNACESECDLETYESVVYSLDNDDVESGVIANDYLSIPAYLRTRISSSVIKRIIGIFDIPMIGLSRNFVFKLMMELLRNNEPTTCALDTLPHCFDLLTNDAGRIFSIRQTDISNKEFLLVFKVSSLTELEPMIGVSQFDDELTDGKDNKGCKPIPRFQAQEEQILLSIKEQGLNPNSLPKQLNGKAGVKAKIKNNLIDSKAYLFTKSTFDKAWSRLLLDQRISYGKVQISNE